ncbi:MAG: hypothetical protein JNK15_14765 [Planctomycetes bacterium]|nr:hypothetical protein [Planctomycetota bacterium]
MKCVLFPTFVALATAAAAPAQARAFAATVGAGPLVALRTSSPLENGSATVWSIADVEGTGKAAPFWRGPGNCDLLARLDRDHLLLASYGEPYALVVVDLTAGTHTILADGAPHEFVALHGDLVLHLGDGRVQSLDPFPYATPWRDPAQRRRLAEIRCERIAMVAGNLAILVGEGERELHSVSLTGGTTRRLWTVPGGADHVKVKLSPAGQRLAIGVVARGKGLLTVVDIATATVVHQWADLPIDVSPLSSNRPTLEVGWHDDAHVVCSETRPRSFTWVRRPVDADTIVDEHDYGPIGLWHDAPPAPSAPAVATAAPRFRWEPLAEGGSALWREGRKEPLRRFAEKQLPHGTLSFAPDGNAVIHCNRVEVGPTLLWHATAEAARPLAEAPAHAVAWLPAAGSPGPAVPR